MQQIIFKANERGIKDIGWLKSNFTFSFSSYQNPSKNGFGLLKVFNDDVVQAGKGFGLHPHQNMEIISIMLQGHMNHKDTLGYSTEIKADGVQIMSAGSGLRHEEYNIGNNEVHFLQIWIEPKLQNINPRYQQRFFPKENRANTLTKVVSHEEGQAHCWINQNATISLGYYTQAATETYTFNPTNKAVFIFAITAGVTINSIQLASKDAIGIWETNKISIDIEPNTEFVVIEIPINH